MRRQSTRWGIIGLTGLLLATSVAVVGPSHHARAAGAGLGPYPCAVHQTNDGPAIQGLFGDAGLIGWQGNHDGVVACLGGSFYVRDGRDTTYGFGLYDESATTWSNEEGYLPALVTRFHREGVDVSITNFADEVPFGGHPYVVVYSRVRVHNPTTQPVVADPAASAGLVALSDPPSTVPPGRTVDHDYAIAADRFGRAYPWPVDAQLRAAGGFEAHFAHMRAFWNGRLASIAQITDLPDAELVNAYKAGFVYTQIIRDGTHLNTGPDNYNNEFSHDVIGILANLFTQGDFADAHALLLRARAVIGSERMYDDGVWKYSWPWAVYLMKTGDVSFVRANFATNGPGGNAEPSIENAAHQIAADRTGPGGIMRSTNDIDSNGYWTIDDYSALFGLAAYRYVAQQVGNTAEAAWATAQYDSLLSATNRTLLATVTANHLDYIPCSIVQPNTSNRCVDPEDANWAAPFNSGRWGWDGYLLGARQTGPAIDLVDDTYRYGFSRLRNVLPPDTFGGYPWRYFYSSGYNAGYGSWGLIGTRYRDQGIRSYEFMLTHTESGPLSWWESTARPKPGNPWVGSHPIGGQGSSPHAWGMANADKVLLDSLVAQRADGGLIVGRGVPTSWIADGRRIAVTNFPTLAGGRVGVTISTEGRVVRLSMTGPLPGRVLFQLPAFVANIASASAGSVDNESGTVTLAPTARTVEVVLRHGGVS
jgi:hypothetical protein